MIEGLVRPGILVLLHVAIKKGKTRRGVYLLDALKWINL